MKSTGERGGKTAGTTLTHPKSGSRGWVPSFPFRFPSSHLSFTLIPLFPFSNMDLAHHPPAPSKLRHELPHEPSDGHQAPCTLHIPKSPSPPSDTHAPLSPGASAVLKNCSLASRRKETDSQPFSAKLVSKHHTDGDGTSSAFKFGAGPKTRASNEADKSYPSAKSPLGQQAKITGMSAWISISHPLSLLTTLRYRCRERANRTSASSCRRPRNSEHFSCLPGEAIRV